MKIRSRILLQALSVSGAIIVILGAGFFFSTAWIRNTAIANLHDLGNHSADLSGYSLEVQLTEKISRIAQDTAFILDERLKNIENHAGVSAESFSQHLDATGIGRNGQLFILDRAGFKIYSSNEDVVARENFFESPSQRLRSLAASMTLGATGITELEMNSIPVYVAYAPIQSVGWSLGVAVSVQEISALTTLIENQIWIITDYTKTEMNRYMLFMTVIIAVLLMLTLTGVAAIAVRFTQAITVPILALNAGVHEVAGGNLKREVHISTGDELEQLAKSFNMMTAQLRKQIEEIAAATAERQRMDTELDIATRIQMSMLPVNFPPFRGRKNEFDLYAQVHPAREVGGDFYDFFFINDDQFVILVADVSGKGIPAAMFMSIAKTVIKNRLQSSILSGGEEPELALEIINRQLCDNNIIDMFVTAWIGILQISSGSLAYINAGHNLPLIKKKGSHGFEVISSPPDFPLAGLADTRYHCRHMQIGPGDLLFLYTDGVTEAINTSGKLYGNDRLINFLGSNGSLPLQEMLLALQADINAFASGAEQADDITMFAIRICDSEGAARSLSLKADIAELHKLIAFIDSGLDAAGCPRRERGQIELAAEEIFANIAGYAYNDHDDAQKLVDVECRLSQDAEKMTMKIIFSDRGICFNMMEYPDPDISVPLDERGIGGMGLLIVKKTMDTISYRRENNINRLELSKSWEKEK